MKVILPILLVFVVLAVLCAHVNLPGTDEAWFASPALNLIAHGNFSTSVLDPTAAFRMNNLTVATNAGFNAAGKGYYGGTNLYTAAAGTPQGIIRTRSAVGDQRWHRAEKVERHEYSAIHVVGSQRHI